MSLYATEYEEQVAFVQYLSLNHLPYFHVPNSTWTNSMNQKRRNLVLGVKPGVPDLFVIVNGQLVAIEMKRTKGGVTSLYQKEWLDLLNSIGVKAVVTRGCDEAIKFIESLKGNTYHVPQGEF